jgi:diguanylate cyclase (GGDEF)-like protein
MQASPKTAPSDRAVVDQTGFALWVASFRQTLHTTPVGWFVGAWMAWGHTPERNLILWLVVFFAAWMMGLLSIHRALAGQCELAVHGLRMRAMAALDGFAWGLVGWLLAGHDVLLDAILVALLCGVSAVNAQVYVSYIRGYYLQSGLMWLVAVLGLSRYANPQYGFDLIVAFSVFQVLMFYHSTRIANRVREGISLQLANAALAQQLRGLLTKVRTDAATDALTGQGNRRALEELLKQQFEFAASTDQPFSILMLDIDYFKKINDIHGHLVGDEALRTFAQRVRDGLRQGDVCTRYGGEEFLIVLPLTTLGTALEVAERLRQAVAAEPLPTSPPLAVTVSIGAATYAPGQTVEALMAAADAAVYRAKRGGRNQVRS